MQQSKKHQFLKTVVLVRDSVHTICDVCRKANSSVNEAAQVGCRSYTFDYFRSVPYVFYLSHCTLIRQEAAVIKYWRKNSRG